MSTTIRKPTNQESLLSIVAATLLLLQAKDILGGRHDLLRPMLDAMSEVASLTILSEREITPEEVLFLSELLLDREYEMES